MSKKSIDGLIYWDKTTGKPTFYHINQNDSLRRRILRKLVQTGSSKMGHVNGSLVYRYLKIRANKWKRMKHAEIVRIYESDANYIHKKYADTKYWKR